MINENKEENFQTKTAEQPESNAATADAPPEEGLYTWQGQERTWLFSGASWYLYGAIFALLLLLYALITQAWTLAILISLLAGTIYLYSQEQSPIVDIILSDKGIYVGEHFYSYTLIKSCWFLFEAHGSFLVIELLNSPQSRLRISFKAEDRVLLQTILKEHIVIDDFHQESLIEKIEKVINN